MSWGMLNYVDKIPTEFDDFGKIKENISAISVIGSCAGGFFGFDKNTFHLSLAVASGVEITLRKLIKNHNSQTTSQIEDDNYIEILELVKDNWKVIGYDILTGSVIAFIAQKGAAAYGPKTSNFISVKLKKYIDSHFGKTIIEVNNKLAKKITNFTKEHVDNAVNYVKNRVIVSGVGSFVNQIDNTLSRLTNLSKFELENTGKYIDVLGHHPLAKSAFRDNFPSDALFKQYYDEAFSVSIPQLEKFGGKGVHAKITGQQNSLYTAWKNANPNVKMTIDDMANIEIQAMVNKGIPQDVATGWVVKALEKVKAQGVTNISNIPWNGVN